MALLRRSSFWPPFIVYISVNNTKALQITFLHTCQPVKLSTTTSHLTQFKKRDPAFCIGNCNKVLLLLNDRYTILRQDLNPQKQSEDHDSTSNHHGWVIQLLNFTEKFSPLPGFKPLTSPVPSWYVTNWAILACK